MNIGEQLQNGWGRRQFLRRSAMGLGATVLGTLQAEARADQQVATAATLGRRKEGLHFPASHFPLHGWGS